MSAHGQMTSLCQTWWRIRRIVGVYIIIYDSQLLNGLCLGFADMFPEVSASSGIRSMAGLSHRAFRLSIIERSVSPHPQWRTTPQICRPNKRREYRPNNQFAISTLDSIVCDLTSFQLP